MVRLQNMKMLHELLDAKTVVMSGCGHMLNLECPERYHCCHVGSCVFLTCVISLSRFNEELATFFEESTKGSSRKDDQGLTNTGELSTIV